jgi:integrase
VLTKSEVRTFLAAAREDRLSALFELAASSGMRPGEYLGLKWEDVDLKKGTVTVRRSLTYPADGKWYFSDPKTKRSRRTIPLPASTVKALRQHKRKQRKERSDLGAAWHHHDLVFTTTNGNAIAHSNLVRRNFARSMKRAGLGTWEGEDDRKRFVPKISIYDLRHTHATLLLQDNVNPKIVSERLGHSTVVITLDTYSHVLPTMQQDAAERLETILYSQAA